MVTMIGECNKHRTCFCEQEREEIQVLRTLVQENIFSTIIEVECRGGGVLHTSPNFCL